MLASRCKVIRVDLKSGFSVKNQTQNHVIKKERFINTVKIFYPEKLLSHYLSRENVYLNRRGKSTKGQNCVIITKGLDMPSLEISSPH